MRRPLLVSGGILAALLALAALGLRWQLARGAERLMTELARASAPLGTLSWRESWAGFDGRFGATGLVFTTDGVRYGAERLTVDLGGPEALLRRLLPGATLEPPAMLWLELAGIELPTRDPRADAATGPVLGLEALDVVPCGGLDAAAVLREVHGDRLVADLALGYRFDATARRLTLDLGLTARELVALRLELELEALGPVTRLEEFARARPIARRGALTLSERGWYAASAAHCAVRSTLDAESWLAAHAVAVQDLIAANGLAPSPALLEGWRDFRSAPATLRIGFDNAALHGADALLAREPREIATLIGLTVAFNGSTVADPGFDLLGSQRLQAAAPFAGAPPAGRAEALLEPTVRALVAPVPAAPPAAAAREPPRTRVGTTRDAAPLAKMPAAPAGSTALTPSTRPLPAGGTTLRWDALRGARGAQVTVLMKDGRTLSGVIKDATPWQLTLEQKLHGGSAVMPLARESVAQVIAER